MLGKTEGERRRGQQRMKLLGSNTDSVDMNSSKLWKIVEDRGTWHTAIQGVTKNQHDRVTEQQDQQIKEIRERRIGRRKSYYNFSSRSKHKYELYQT